MSERRARIGEEQVAQETEEESLVPGWIGGVSTVRVKADGERRSEARTTQWLGSTGLSQPHQVPGPCLHPGTITWARETSQEGDHRLLFVLHSLQHQRKESSEPQHLENTHCEPQAWVGNALSIPGLSWGGMGATLVSWAQEPCSGETILCREGMWS